VAGRTVSKLLWALRAGRLADADVFIGYHIIPNGTIALVAARLLGRHACYQMTGGPIELLGGGYLATENPVLGRLRGPSARLERLALAVVSRFDLVVVRGRSAERFVSGQTGAPAIAVIPGSVDLARVLPVVAERSCDLIYVGRLAQTKQPVQFVEIVDAVRRRLPDVRARMVGDGPLMGAVRQRITELGLEQVIDVRGQLDQVIPWLQDARAFVLTSRSEGLSIAMVEAMVSGAVPVVANVGDLGDLVAHGENGFLIEPDNIEQYADHVVSIVSDRNRWHRLSAAASRSAREYNSLERVAGLWRTRLGALTASPANAPADADIVKQQALAGIGGPDHEGPQR
jgi:glycosyltransferase involved in cell wall biosynthesis